MGTLIKSQILSHQPSLERPWKLFYILTNENVGPVLLGATLKSVVTLAKSAAISVINLSRLEQ